MLVVGVLQAAPVEKKGKKGGGESGGEGWVGVWGWGLRERVDVRCDVMCVEI